MVDILVLNYNDAATTIAFINSVVEYDIVRRILVVDNASKDDSVQEIKRNVKNKKIELIQNFENGGYGKGNNLGIKHLYYKCQSEKILLCNPDIIVSEETIRRLDEFLSSHQEIALASAQMLDRHFFKQRNTAFKIPSVLKQVLALSVFYSILFKPFYYDNLDADMMGYKIVDCLTGSMFMMSAKKMIQYGMFDENMFLYGEELALGIKMKQNKQQLALLPNVSYIHNHGVSINKSVCKMTARHKLLLKSHLYIIKELCKANQFTMFCAKCVAFFSLLEIQVISFLKFISRK